MLAAFYPGSGGGEAIAGVLFGRVNPSGHLPVTFPKDVTQLPHPQQRDPETTTSNPGTPLKGGVFHVDYNIEGSDVGYRWFARQQLKPLFPFGHGLSYTSFQFSNLETRVENGKLVAAVTVKNTGSRAGADVPQLYVDLPGKDGFATRLVGFKRVERAPGETQQIDMQVDPRLLARFDADQRHWVIRDGRYRIRVAEDALATGVSTEISLPGSTFTP